jgi:hypothetical protein
MMYVVAFSGSAALLVCWCIVRFLRDRRLATIKQERLASAFERSHAIRSHGHGAVAISQNLLIAELAAHAAGGRR